MHSREQGAVLLAMARSAIDAALGMSTKADQGNPVTVAEADTASDWLQVIAGTFVTLTQTGQLRGCIGTLEAWRPLRTDVQANAVAAALHDPRFEPLQHQELPHTRVEVSLLSVPIALDFVNEADALRQLRPGIDGVVLTHRQHLSTFLPQVWEQLPDPTDFMRHLKQKARLPAHFWAQDLHLQRYTVTKWKEPA